MHSFHTKMEHKFTKLKNPSHLPYKYGYNLRFTEIRIKIFSSNDLTKPISKTLNE